MSTMPALQTVPGSARPDLAQVPVPEPTEEQILVRTRAVAVNNADVAVAADVRVPGFEFCGEVVAVGTAVESFAPGQRVAGVGAGAFAEYVAVLYRHVMSVPEGVPSDVAAALPTALLTEYGALRRAGLQAGETVLITAATSAIGLVGMQVAAELGAARVLATTRNEERRALLERAGADAVVVTSSEDLATRVRELTDGAGADVVLDHVGGDALDGAIAAARPGGRVISVGRLAGPTAEIDLFALARSGAVLQSVSFGFTPVEIIGRQLDGVARDLSDAVSRGRVAPVIGRRVPFADLPETLAALAAGEHVDGKAVAVAVLDGR
ncbi:zinc-binding dehydrogenase [Isoptericola chiayiensis]|uniref:Zinc-binding dehydrogenase n=1 Tax=Isoptericola chiayiensis TaxID=579446 RepID=A0ABP8YJW4_9MICO|nr:zinc-binding dehydrogenase [Isoptericola chiayiensis]NOW00532.1 NADPH:quinone reductase-like Zn-dependent oxidoreductase [Isoptericola chiayiensis]